MEFEATNLGSLGRHPTELIVLYQEHSTQWRISGALEGMNVRLDIRRPSCGEPVREARGP